MDRNSSEADQKGKYSSPTRFSASRFSLSHSALLQQATSSNIDSVGPSFEIGTTDHASTCGKGRRG